MIDLSDKRTYIGVTIIILAVIYLLMDRRENMTSCSPVVPVTYYCNNIENVALLKYDENTTVEDLRNKMIKVLKNKCGVEDPSSINIVDGGFNVYENDKKVKDLHIDKNVFFHIMVDYF